MAKVGRNYSVSRIHFCVTISRYRKKEEGGGGDGEDEEEMEVDKSPEKVNMFMGVLRISHGGGGDFEAQ